MGTAGELRVSASDLRGSAQRLRQVASDFAAAWQTFCEQVRSLGDIFGDDDVSGLIGASYQAAHALADETFESIVTALGDFASGLERMAESYEAAEQDNVRNLVILERQ